MKLIAIACLAALLGSAGAYAAGPGGVHGAGPGPGTKEPGVVCQAPRADVQVRNGKSHRVECRVEKPRQASSDQPAKP
jgi:hypothetical protein